MTAPNPPASASPPRPWVVIEHNHAGGDLWLSIGYTGADRRTWGPVADIVGKTDFYTPIAELKYLATSPDEQRANAALIVQAVNAYAPLVEALEACLDRLQGVTGVPDPAGQARAALALEKGGRS